MMYRTIVADPPWELDFKRMGVGGRRKRETAVPYEFMSLDEICALDVPAADDAHLYLWSTRKLFREGIAAKVARAWGFEPCGEIIWGLRNPGMGAAFLANDHEPVLIARRGNLPFAQERIGGVHFWKQLYVDGGKAHSAKPEAFMDVVERISPEPRLEMFSRRARIGWDTWGDQALGGAGE
jgi:N6-adenosine-specific RNA methylase IME4